VGRKVGVGGWLIEIKLRAVRRIGELSLELDKAPSGKAAHSLPSNGKSKSRALKAAKISKSTAHRCEQVAAIPQKEFDAEHKEMN
jgi:hypothetical protein